MLEKDYRMGIGAPIDMKLAHEHFMKAAAWGCMWAHHELGRVYMLEYDVKKSVGEGTRWFRAGAEKGFPPCQHALALVLDDGDVQ